MIRKFYNKKSNNNLDDKSKNNMNDVIKKKYKRRKYFELKLRDDEKAIKLIGTLNHILYSKTIKNFVKLPEYD